MYIHEDISCDVIGMFTLSKHVSLIKDINVHNLNTIEMKCKYSVFKYSKY